MLMHDVQWFANMEAFDAHVDMSVPERKDKLMTWVGRYDKGTPFKGTVYGGFDEHV